MHTVPQVAFENFKMLCPIFSTVRYNFLEFPIFNSLHFYIILHVSADIFQSNNCV